jgi:hypothetical protein
MSGPGIALAVQALDAERREDLGILFDHRLRFGCYAGVEAVDAAAAEIAFRAELLQVEFGGMVLGVGLAAVEAGFLVAEGDHAHGAARRLLSGGRCAHPRPW